MSSRPRRAGPGRPRPGPVRRTRSVRRYLLLALRAGAAPFEATGTPIETPPADRDFGDLLHPENWDEAVEVSSKWIIDEAALWFARTRAIFGTAAQVNSKLDELEAAGTRHFLVMHPGAFTLPIKLIDGLIADILPLRRP
jgi:hypothetical protein